MTEKNNRIGIGSRGHSPASWICASLVSIGGRVANHFNRNLAEFDISQAQFRILRAIQTAEGGIVTPSQLADRMLIERATISFLVAKLVERGLVCRGPGANRRTYFLSLSEAGFQLMGQILPIVLALAQDTLKQIHEDRLLEIREMLTEVESALSAAENLAP